jgi:hypothetical protein
VSVAWSIIGKYRIYPSWFHGTGGPTGGAQTPINELAQSSAKRMGRQVTGIEIVRTGRDFRGDYVDFNVSYSSVWVREKSS